MRANSIDYPVEKIRGWIEEGKTQAWIAEALARSVDSRITPKLIYKVCKKHRIQCHRTGPRSGSGHPNWKGGRRKNRNGYIEVYCPHHPVVAERNTRTNRPGAYKHPNNYYEEHRLVAERKIGRYLLPEEVVHHIDGDKENNNPDNLQVFDNNGAHLRATLAGKCPQWTDDGKARIQAGVDAVAHTRRTMREHGAPLSLQTKIRPIAELLESGLSPSQTACTLGIPQAQNHPTQGRDEGQRSETPAPIGQ